MARTPEFRERVQVHTSIEKKELDILEDIRWREHKERAEVLREAIVQYIKAHAAGNSTFRLDEFVKNPEFQITPTILSRPEIWFKYLKSCTDEERLRIQVQSFRILNQCKGIK